MHLVLSWSTTEKSLALPSLHPPFRYLQTLVLYPLIHLQAEQAQLSHSLLIAPLLHALHFLHGLSLVSLQCAQVSLVLRHQDLDPAHQVWPHQC